MAVLVAAMMIVAMAVPAWAAVPATQGRFVDTEGSITISTTVSGEEYNLYKIFDLASFDDDNTAQDEHGTDRYSYVIAADSKWLPFFRAASKPSATAANMWGSYYINVAPVGSEITINETSYYPVTGYNTQEANSSGFDEETSGDNTIESDFVQNDSFYSQSSQLFARAAEAYIKATIDSASTTDHITADETVTGDGTAQTLDTLDLGYYLLTSSTGTLISLDSTNPTVTMYEKNDLTDIDKFVQEDSESFDTTSTTKDDGYTGYKPINDADIGDTVYFRSVVPIKKGAKKYIVHDTMEAGFTFTKLVTTPGAGETYNPAVYIVKDYASITDVKTQGSLVAPTGTVAKVDSTGLGTAITLGAGKYNWRLLDGSSTELAKKDSDSTFEIEFSQDFLDEVDKQINSIDDDESYSFVILYNAVLNSGANIGTTGNKNEVWITYGDASTTKSAKDTTTTYTWDFDLFKYYMDGATKTELPGAQFQIKRGATALNFVEIAKGEYLFDSRHGSESLGTTKEDDEDKLASELRVVKSVSVDAQTSGTKNLVNILEPNAQGFISVYGLDGGDYVVSEYLAPRGYYKLKDDINVHIVSCTEDTADTIKIQGDTDNSFTMGQVITFASGSTTVGTALSDSESNVAKVSTVLPAARMLEVENKFTTELPSTGGMGTTVLYIVGGMLVILAGAYLFFSRKRTA